MGFYSGPTPEPVDEQGFYDGPDYTPVAVVAPADQQGNSFYNGPQSDVVLDEQGFYDGPGLEQLDPVAVEAFRDQAEASAATAVASAAAAAVSATEAATAISAATGTATPLMDGAAEVGTAPKWAHEDHRHPVDTSRADAAATTAALALKADAAATTAALALKAPLLNRIINGDMMVSQQNGTAAGTTTGYYAVDMFAMHFVNAGTQTAQQVASATPAGSTHRLRVTATVADAAVAAGDVCFVEQRIEGLRISDMFLGTASAKTITVQFGVKAPAGTYCVALRNGSSNRSYAAEYVIAPAEANTDVVKSVTVTLDQTGTWVVDNTIGIQVTWVLMCGTTYQTTAGAWAAGNFIASSNQFNFMGTASNVFELFDVSLVVGSTAPEHQVQDYALELALCKRYYQLITNPPGSGLANGAASIFFWSFPLPVEMRAVPTISLGGSGVIFTSPSATYTANSIATNLCTTQVWMATMGTTAPVPAGYLGTNGTSASAVIADARL